MKKILLIAFAITIVYTNLFSQNYSIEGIVIDKQNDKPLKSASVSVHRKRDSLLLKGEVTDKDGKFKIEGIEHKNIYLKINFVGYKPFYKDIKFETEERINLGKLVLEPDVVQMKSVQVVGDMVRAEIKQDTTEFNTKAIKTQPNAEAEELIKKIPGVQVDRQTGSVKAQGEDVKEVLVNGRQYFGDDPMMAMRNLPADVIDRVQIFDKMSEQAQFSGFDDGSRYKAMNLITKSGMLVFGKLYGGYGYQDKYTAGGNVNWMTSTSRLSIIGMSNNVNQLNFNFQDILGIFGSGGSSSRSHGPSNQVRQRIFSSGSQFFRPPAGGGPFGSLADFFVGNLNGLTTTHAIGANYTDIFAEKLQVNLSYFLNYTDNENDEDLWRRYFLETDTNYLYNQTTLNNTKNLNHRINGRIEWNLDSNSRLIIRPNGSIQSADSRYSLLGQSITNVDQLLNSQDSRTNSDYGGYNFSNETTFLHRFDKKGRTLSLSIRNQFNKNDGDYFLDSYYNELLQQFSDTLNQYNKSLRNGATHRGEFTYTEPIDTNMQISLSYEPSISNDKEDRSLFQFNPIDKEYNIIDSSLSNYSLAQTISQRVGLGYRLTSTFVDFNINLNYQITNFTNEKQKIFPYTIEKNYYNWLPRAFFNFKISDKSSIRAHFSVSSQTPSVTQLSPVVNNSNPLQITAGNPNLNQSITYNFFTRYFGIFNNNRSNFFIMFNLSKTEDYISNITFFASKDTIINNYNVIKGTQVSIPQNFGSSYSARSFTTLSVPVDLIKSTLNLNGGFSYTEAPGQINGVDNLSKTYTYNIGFDLNSNISPEIDFSVGTSTLYNVMRNNVRNTFNGEYYNIISYARINWTFWKSFFVSLDLNHRYSTGYSTGYNQDLFITNLTIGNRTIYNNNFDVRLQVFDLFDQTKSISRNITDAYFEDINSLVLRRYGMLSVTYYLRPF